MIDSVIDLTNTISLTYNNLDLRLSGSSMPNKLTNERTNAHTLRQKKKNQRKKERKQNE